MLPERDPPPAPESAAVRPIFRARTGTDDVRPQAEDEPDQEQWSSQFDRYVHILRFHAHKDRLDEPGEDG